MSGEPSAQRPIAGSAGREPAPSGAVDVELAHQLNTLLDGALRCVDQAQQALAGGSDESNQHGAPSPQQIEHARQRIELAGQSMRRMAGHLEQTMASRPQPAEAQPQRVNTMERANACSCVKSLAATVDEACRWLAPLTEPLGITIDTHLTPEAADLPAGPLETVVLNALRNAVDACARNESEPRAIELVATCQKQMLRIVIADTGPGVEVAPQDNPLDGKTHGHHGHGLGLHICRRIVHELNGEVRLMNIPFSRGAVFHLQVPVNRLPAA